MKTLNFCLVFAIISSITVCIFCETRDRFLRIEEKHVMCVYINKPSVDCENLCKEKMNAEDGFCRQPHCFCTDVPEKKNLTNLTSFQ
nr:putative NaTx Tcis48 [Tityus cisandinus]